VTLIMSSQSKYERGSRHPVRVEAYTFQQDSSSKVNRRSGKLF